MTSIKKMKLVPMDHSDQQNNLNQVLNTFKLTTSPYLKKATNLDLELKSILDSGYDERIKTKLYGKVLKSFLTSKRKYEDEEVKKGLQFGDTISKTVKKLIPELTQFIDSRLETPIKKIVPKKPKIKRSSKKRKVLKFSPKLTDIVPSTTIPSPPRSKPPSTPSPSPLISEAHAKSPSPEKQQQTTPKISFTIGEEFNPFLRKDKVSRSPTKPIRKAKEEAKLKSKELAEDALIDFDEYTQPKGNDPEWMDYRGKKK